MSLKSSYITYSAEETEQLGQELASALRGQNILLYGELGAGKTTFLRGLAVGLKVAQKVKSPTFVYEKIYELSGKETFIHFDLYRLKTVDVEMSEHLKEAFNNPNATVAVEWSERLSKDLLPQQRVELKLEEDAGDERRLSLKVFS